jgi:hypothetical protein
LIRAVNIGYDISEPVIEAGRGEGVNAWLR